MKVQFFVPCFIDQFYPHVAVCSYELLKKSGVEVIYPKKQACCGQPAYNSGYLKEAKQVCQSFTQLFDDTLPIVVPSVSCKSMIQDHFSSLLSPSPSYQVYELSEYLTNVAQYDCSHVHFQAKAIIHDSCTALRACRITQESRYLLKQVQGLDILDYPDSDICCGFGGSFFLKFDSISKAMGRNKIDTFDKLTPDCIISLDVSCFMNLNRIIEERNLPLKTYHISEILLPT